MSLTISISNFVILRNEGLNIKERKMSEGAETQFRLMVCFFVGDVGQEVGMTERDTKKERFYGLLIGCWKHGSH